jgi:hypothetical protein
VVEQLLTPDEVTVAVRERLSTGGVVRYDDWTRGD